MRKPAQSLDDKRLKNMDRQAEEHRLERPRRERDINNLLSGDHPDISVRLHDDGTCDIVSPRSVLKFTPDGKTVMRGTMLTSPNGPVLNTANRIGTVEADIFHHLLNLGLRAALAKTIVRDALQGAWVLANDDNIRLTGCAARRGSYVTRPDLGWASIVGGKEARQIYGQVPFLLGSHGLDIMGLIATVGGQNALLQKLGLPSAVTSLKHGNEHLVTPRNYEHARDFLVAAKAANTNLPKMQQRLCLETYLAAAWRPEPKPGFLPWLAKELALSGDRLIVTADVDPVAIWAGDTTQWRETYSLADAHVKSRAWAEKEAKRIGSVLFPIRFKAHGLHDDGGNGHYVRQLGSADELRWAGDRLHNCLRLFAPQYAKSSFGGTRIVVGIFKAKWANSKSGIETIKEGPLVAAAELALPDMTVVQLRGACNAAASADAELALTQAIRFNKEGDAA